MNIGVWLDFLRGGSMNFDPKKVAVLGGGHGAHCMAADLASRGFMVNLFEMPEFQHNLSKLNDTKEYF